MNRAVATVFLVMLARCMPMAAQDERTVTEPVAPPACITLDAQKTVAEARMEDGGVAMNDTARIQRALDQCGEGHAVVLRGHGSRQAFLSGPLELRNGVALVIERGVVLFASRNPAAFADSEGSCGLVNNAAPGCRPIIRAQGVTGAAVMGEGTIDGQGGEKLLGRNTTWWNLAEQARAGGRQQVPRLIVADHADDFTLYGITLKNSPNFHVVYNHGDGLTVWGVKIDTPQRGARNTDGIDPGQGSKNITITHSFIRTGDDNVALKGGPGGLTNVTVSDNHFYWGHGMSIGSETDGGVSKIRVSGLTLDGPDNGLRIKSNGSRGGLVRDVVYEHVCIRDSPHPIALDTGYTAAGTPLGSSPPTFRGIGFHDVQLAGGGKISFDGYDATHRVEAFLDDVNRTDTATYTVSLHHADLHLGPGAVNLELRGGVDSTITGRVADDRVAGTCAGKFLPFPAR